MLELTNTFKNNYKRLKVRFFTKTNQKSQSSVAANKVTPSHKQTTYEHGYFNKMNSL